MASRTQELLGRYLDQLKGLDEGNLVPRNQNSTSLTLDNLHAAYIMKRSLNQLALLEAQAGKGNREAIDQLIQIAKGSPVF